MSPLLNDAQLADTKRAIESFRAGDGPGLQSHLEAWDKEHPSESFISAMWYEYYLKVGG